MNKTKIEWCDSTWNPVTGCLHGCPYCYARRITERFRPHEFELMSIDACKPILPISAKNLGCYECNEPVKLMNSKGEIIRTTHYPMGFKPTLHRYRLNEPMKKRKPQSIFVCSMADLFGSWVPDEWIQEVFRTCASASQHNFLFLTKNPFRYEMLYESHMIPLLDNMWYGFTITGNNTNQNWTASSWNTFISIEPLLERLNSETLRYIALTDWVIIGAETGQNKNKIVPEKEWIDDIVKVCKLRSIPVFMKDSLIPIMCEENMLREFPKELERE